MGDPATDATSVRWVLRILRPRVGRARWELHLGISNGTEYVMPRVAHGKLGRKTARAIAGVDVTYAVAFDRDYRENEPGAAEALELAYRLLAGGSRG